MAGCDQARATLRLRWVAARRGGRVAPDGPGWCSGSTPGFGPGKRGSRPRPGTTTTLLLDGAPVAPPTSPRSAEARRDPVRARPATAPIPCHERSPASPLDGQRPVAIDHDGPDSTQPAWREDRSGSPSSTGESRTLLLRTASGSTAWSLLDSPVWRARIRSHALWELSTTVTGFGDAPTRRPHCGGYGSALRSQPPRTR